MAFVGKAKADSGLMRRLEEERREKLEELYEDPFVGYTSLQDAIADSKITSQAEVLARLLKKESLFISGLPGAGKTTIINRFVELIKNEYENSYNVAVTASTGIAGALIGGETIHRWAGLGISTDPFNPKEIPYQMKSKEWVIKKTDVLIIDEISMLPAYLFTKLDALLKHFRKSDKPFGGVQLVLIGDFLQLPPVTNKSSEDLDCRFAIETEAWKNGNIGYAYLDKTHRAVDSRLKQILIEMSNDKLSEKSRALIQSRIDQPKQANTAYTVLFTTNKVIDKYNNEQLEANPSKKVTFKTRSKFGITKDCERVVKMYGLQEEIHLKVGATVMLTSNILYNGAQVANGSIGVVTSISNGFPSVKFNNGTRMAVAKKVYELTEKEEKYDPVTQKKYSFDRTVAQVEQLPLKLAYAITVHKSQGQSFDGVILDLSKIFQSGLGYVALSRVRSLDDLIITGISDKALLVSPKSKKINTYVKKKAFLARRAAVEDLDVLDSLLSNELYRGMYWDREAKPRNTYYDEPF